MIANSYTNKLKASRGLKETESVRLFEAEDRGKSSEKGEEDKERTDTHRSSFQSVSCSRERSDRSKHNRSKHRDDYRMARGGPADRRGGSRGRGGSHRKSERNGDSGYISRGKFQESMSKGKSCDSMVISSGSKYITDAENTKYRPAEYSCFVGLPEDSRISKVLRRMAREDDPEKLIGHCNQLQEALSVVDNGRYIRRALDLICDSLLDLLHSGQSLDVKNHIARCLGKVGYVLEQDFKRFVDWFFPTYMDERNGQVRQLLMKALLETLELERDQPRVKDFAPQLMARLQAGLETTEVAESMISTVEVVMSLVNIYPETFPKHFTDLVDILVGWHIDHLQPHHVVWFASFSIQRLYYWSLDIPFSLTMLGNFLEDIESYADEFCTLAKMGSEKLASTEETLHDISTSHPVTMEVAMAKLTLFIKVFNTVTKGLGRNLNPNVTPEVSWAFLNDCLAKVLSNVLPVLECSVNEELIISGNECTWLLLSLLQNKTCPTLQELYHLIDFEITHSRELSDLTVASVLQLIAKVVRELSANLPLELVQRLLQPNSVLLELRFSTSLDIHTGVVAVYHSLLSLKNIPLLKEAYRLILGDLEAAYRILAPNIEPLCGGIAAGGYEIVYSRTQVEYVILFHLKALADIANASNSLIGMWVLQPSILELLGVKLARLSVEKLSPPALYALLYLLYSHCSRHNHFISSSSLIGFANVRPAVQSLLGTSEMTRQSPTIGNLAVILNLLADIIVKDMCEESKCLLLNWTCELLSHAQTYLLVLSNTDELCHLVTSICKMSSSLVPRILLAVYASLEHLLIPACILNWKVELLNTIFEACMLHINSTDSQVAEKCASLILRLPWMLVIPNLTTFVSKSDSGWSELAVAQHSHMTRGTNGEMQPQHFRQLMSYLLQGYNQMSGIEWLHDVFSSCWAVCEARSESGIGDLAYSSRIVLLFWAVWESAQLCVTCKLRTPLGKPADTFMAFEGAIKSLARETMQKSVVTESVTPFDVQRVRLLLEFVEHLEKAMYNAADGTATALLTPPKPVRTFFYTNKSTCAEWLTRNRMAIVVVSLHAGLASSAVRHGYCLLQDLLDAGNTKGADFENAVLHVAWALYKLKEAEAVQGLYVWCRDIVGCKILYLKALADQAAGRFETAADSYSKIISSDLCASPSPFNDANSEGTRNSFQTSIAQTLKCFVSDQLTECYLALGDWAELAKWKEQEAEFIGNQNGGTSLRHKYMNNKMASALIEFEKEDYSAASELTEWKCPDSHIDRKETWDCYQLLGNTKHNLTNLAINFAATGTLQDCCKENIRQCQSVAQLYMTEGLRNTPSETLEEAAILQFASSALLGQQDVFFSVPDETKQKSKLREQCSRVGSSTLTQFLWWNQVLNKITGNAVNDTALQIGLDVACRARKEGNMNLAKRQLCHHLHYIFNHDNGIRTPSLLPEIANNILAEVKNTAEPWSLQRVAAFTEVAKLLYNIGESEWSVEMCSATILGIGQNEENIQLRERCSRLLLTLAKWVSQYDCNPQCYPNSLQKLLLWEENIGQNMSVSLLDVANCQLGVEAVIPANDCVVGQLLRLSVLNYPSLSKSWSHLAAWAYRWGRRVLDKTEYVLTQSDKEAMEFFIPDSVDKSKVYEILCHTRPSASDEEDIEAESINTSEMIQWKLESIGIFTSEQLAGLIEMWQKSHARVYSYYQLSAYSYFKYLQLCDAEYHDCAAITATLRLLRLIVKHALELQSVLEVGLATTPTLPWICIIPQLFSRLSHPQPYVQRRVSELLCRLAADNPHLIIFPAVVGSDAGSAATIRDMPQTKLFHNCMQNSDDEDIDVVEDDEDEDDDDEEDSGSRENIQASVLENCFQAMVDTLAKQAPEAISQVQLLVRELRRITLLWDELWLGTLVQHHADMSRRVTQLETEIIRVDMNPHLSTTEKDRLVAEKHRIILKPILFVLDQLHVITSVTPETPHEQWFQDKFGDSIKDMLEKLCNPVDPRKPNEAWNALKALQCKLQARATKRASYALRMSDVSPALADLHNTQIAMPGVKTVLTISAIHNHIAVLPTKTKPKKLVFQGSDGKMYTYLFKGLEDLHLDERIMQFLCIANTMLRGSGYHAHHYAVIPLGPRSGLISWVDHVTPLFALYKRWQQRQAAINQSTVMRPSELFYSKLTPLLKECDITNLDSRKEWPLPVLKQVLTELMQETPTYLLSKELWCNSVNAGSWWHSTKFYSMSLAVMSIIGYIIGLGDRHLDNVLVDLNTGEVVHIDYNVCFEKGKTLRVPEKVPFRLTPNLRATLGVTGVEGMFRLTCEHVLKVMKKGRETVLTLLEAFVYDPLIDWTPGNEAGYTGAVYGGGRAAAATGTRQTRKQLEHEVTSAMFAVRITEMRYDWLENRDKLLVALPELSENLHKWLEAHALLKKTEDSLQERHQQMALVKEAEAHAQHSLYTLPARYSAHTTAVEATNKAKAGLQEKIEECEHQLSQYKMAISYFYGPKMAQWVSDVNSRTKHDNYMVFDLIKEFLQNAGQSQMVLQCIQSEKELSDLCCQQTQLTAACLDLLGQYGAVVRLFPSSYLSQHRATLYRRWAQSLIECQSLERCEAVISEMKVLAPPQANSPAVQQIITYNLGLHRLLTEARATLSKCLDKANNSSNKDITLQEAERVVINTAERSPLAVECIVVTALCSLNKRFLMMETAAKSAMDCLVDLTSREGDWFLEDMCLLSGIVTKLSTLLPSPDCDPRLQLALKCLQAAYNQYKGLQELNQNFTSIILPEAIQTVQKEDPSVLSLMSELNSMIAGAKCPLPELITQLQLHLRFVIMGMESPHENCQHIVQELRTAFESLVHSPEAADTLSPGQMLFMGFNGLFENLALGGNSLIATLSSLQTPTSWKNVDQLREAKTLLAPVYDAAPRTVLEDIFLVKRLQTMQELFALCESNAAGFRGGSNAPTAPLDDDRLNRPVRRFTADYVSCQLLGVFSHTLAITVCLLLQNIGVNVTGEVEQRDIGAESRVPLDDLCRMGVEGAVRRNQLAAAALSQASAAVSSVETAWRRSEITKRISQETQRAEVSVQRLQLQLTAHHWLHEDYLALAQILPLPPISRPAFMLELRKTCAALVAMQPRLSEAHEQQSALVASAEQRLKWAAGANPALSEVMCAFETSVSKSNEQLIMEQRSATMVANICNYVVQHEALRTRTSEALANDSAFLQLIENWKKSCYLCSNLNFNLSTVEEGLVKLLSPEHCIDWAWIAKAEGLISDSVKTLVHQIEPQQIAVFSAQDCVKTKASSIRSLLNTHHRIMADIRTLLKTMTKFEDSGVAGLGEYLTRYKAYTECLSALFKSLVSDEELTTEKVHAVLNEITIIQEETPGIYEELLQFSIDNSSKVINKRPPLVRQESVCMSPKHGVPRDPHTGKAVQERNAYAVSVWRRVRMKLEGKDPDPNRRYSVQEQVDWAINEATSLDNLALLYEGWTPWV